MAIYYIENPNGKYPSEDGSRRFDKLSGRTAYEYLQTTEGKGKRFMKANEAEDDSDIIYVEVRKQDIPAFRVDERREQYVNDCIEQSGIITISLYACEGLGDDGDTISGEELIEDERSAIEAEVVKNVEIELLHKALASLKEAEIALITALFLQEKPLTEEMYSKQTGIPQQTISYRKNAIFKKLKKYF